MKRLTTFSNYGLGKEDFISRRRCAKNSVAVWVFFMVVGLFFLADSVAAQPAARKDRWEEWVGRAKQEGKMTLLGPPLAELRPSLMQAFQKAFPEIALEYQAGIVAFLVEKLRAEIEQKKNSLDIVIGGTSLLREKNLLEPIPPKLLLPEVINPEAWESSKGKGLKWIDKESQFVLQTSEWVFGYVVVNTKLVNRDQLTTWQDLLKPQWKGKIAFYDPRGAGAGQEVASYLLVKFGEKFIVDLFKGQDVALTRSYSQIADWVAQGKYAVGIAQVPDRIEALKKEGVPLQAFSLSDAPGTLSGGFSVVSLLKGRPHPNAAAIFVNWILTKAGQEALHRPQLYPSLRKDVPTDHVPPYTIVQRGLNYLDTYTEEFQAKRGVTATKVQDLLGR
ncbi:MAG: extracellular solute-binding protein [Deltaproteobacteria bacterium]|nr:MAG: extracellular solute-binding protein [Deltaproteobacteria bacterium]